jgi:hypothetical protein
MADRDIAIPLSNGTVLAGSLYVPDGDGPHPALLSYYPYRKDDIIGGLFDATRRRLVDRGYADLLVDMTGTGGSEGDYGESFNLKREGRDAAEIVEWVAAQDWCDGNVGIWGVSYGGFIAFAAASEKPPHLKAIVPVYATTDSRQRLEPGGCRTCFGWYCWAAHMLALDLLPPTSQDAAGKWRRTWEQRLRRMKNELPHGLDWQVHPQDDDYWTAGRVDLSGVGVPALLIAGWRDAYTDSMLEAHARLTGPRRTVIGPWAHVVPHLADVEPWDWVGAMSDWWDRYLVPKAVSGLQESSVVYFVQGANVWRADDKWPPTGSSETRLYLVEDRLETEPQPGTRTRSYDCDPTVGVDVGIWDPFGTGLGGPEEQSSDEARSLTFTTAPLDAPMEIVGKAVAELLVSFDGDEEAQLSAKLSAISPDGRSALIASGMCSCPPAPTGTRTGPLAGAVTRSASVDIAATAFALHAGYRLRLSVALADFPHYWPTPTNPRMTLWTGGGRPSVLRLPVAAGDGASEPVGVEMARPPTGPDPGWLQFGQPSHIVQKDRATGEVSVSLGLSARVKTPLGAVLSNDELFCASVRPVRPDAARLVGASRFEVDMPAGERVVVETSAVYQRQASVCHGSVTIDGVLIFDHSWSNVDRAVGHGQH